MKEKLIEEWNDQNRIDSENWDVFLIRKITKLTRDFEKSEECCDLLRMEVAYGKNIWKFQI